jgi:hypothetical protein
MQTKHQFYHTGVDNQKRADITIDLKRLDKEKMKEWTVSEKIMAKAFIKRVSGIFEVFKNEILDAIK